MFSKLYGLSPTLFRRTKKNIKAMEKQKEISEINLSRTPKIVEVPTRTVLYINAKGDYGKVDYSSAFARLWQEVKAQQLFSAGIEHIVFYHDNPCVTESEFLSCDICLTIRRDAVPNGEVGVKRIEGGKYAVFTYIGEYNGIGAAYDRIYSSWFPESGYKMGNRPCFEKYVSDPHRVAPEKRKTEIYVAVD